MKNGLLKVNASIIALLVFFLFALTPLTSNAQLQSTDITIATYPQNPAPGETVTATVRSYATDLNKANIIWSLNGQSKAMGIGKTKFYFSNGDHGTTTTVSVDIEIISGQTISQSLTLSGTTVDMLWEATDSYTPPFYRGKARVAKEGSFKVVAMPNIFTSLGNANPNNLSYRWEKDGVAVQQASGWGKTSLIFKNTYLENSNSINVTVSDILGQNSTSGSLTLNPIEPKIVFYEKDLKLGVLYNKSLKSNYTLNAGGSVLYAAPYFFSPKDIEDKNLTFTWSVDGDKLFDQLPKNELRVKGEEGRSGNATINLLVANVRTLFQEVDQDFNVSF